MKIAVDIMGGDNAPQAVLDGCRLALPEMPESVRLLLYGDGTVIRDAFPENDPLRARIEIVPTTEVVSCEESPTAAVRKKKDSSLVRAIADVSAGQADCIVSAGSTGALLTGATLIIRRQSKVKRPALAALLPSATGCVMLIDSGANTDCKPQYLPQFAVMGTAYMRGVMGVSTPRVGLLSNGQEREKGNELTKAAYPLLEQTPVNFVGSCEARDVLSGQFDVVVCDGFDGNIVLKGAEGVVSLTIGMLKQSLYGSVRGKLGALIAKPAFSALKKKLDYAEYGGAPLLGVSGGVIKAHGSSSAKAFKYAILQAYRLIDANVIGIVGETIAALPEMD